VWDDVDLEIPPPQIERGEEEAVEASDQEIAPTPWPHVSRGERRLG
jgi:hypothetical protein